MSGGAETAPRPTIAEAMRGRGNSLGLLRLVLAVLVVFSHAVPLGGWGEDPVFSWSKGQENLGGFAVLGFFAISGYLISRSGMSSAFVPYLWRRVLRIFPAFWLVLLVGIVIVGPIAWFAEGRGLGEYASRWPGGPLWYFLGNWDLRIGQWGIHDIFVETTPYGQAVGYSVFNGSLWTLAYEFFCYLLIGALVLFGLIRRAPWIVPVLTAVFFVLQVIRLVSLEAFALVLGPFADPYLVNLTLVFLWGSVLAVYGSRVPIDDRAGWASVVLVFGTAAFGGFGIIGLPALGYALLWAAVRLPEPMRRVGARNDYSYGLYLYGFLAQQLLAYFGLHLLGYVPYVLGALLLAGACAVASWHLVERPALELKNRGPGRGARYWIDRARNRRPKAGTRTEGKL
ncbi:acyltransferase family protein [Agromyces archimandritae]|uniref:Acyltransferase n=1 Tax=Agromyces archimandritae TaxID=2781962 RepID=A0A975IPH1_9MICO|nr:acyltransferase [Agromyces archimandritae]QTX05269.1 acyltransferase [Agromyces archimandritae]